MLTKCVEANPNFWIGWVDLGYLHIDLENWQKAADFLDRGVKLAKSNPEVNKKNEALWFDLTNAVRNYILVLKQIQMEKREAKSEAKNEERGAKKKKREATAISS